MVPTNIAPKRSNATWPARSSTRQPMRSLSSAAARSVGDDLEIRAAVRDDLLLLWREVDGLLHVSVHGPGGAADCSPIVRLRPRQRQRARPAWY
jgi:hypothetical protein